MIDGSHAIRELRALYRISQAIHACQDLSLVVRRTLEILAEELGMQRGTLALVNPRSGELAIQVAHGLSDREVRRGRYRDGEGVVGRVLASGEPLAVPNVGAEPLFLNRTGARRELERSRVAFLCVPVLWAGETVGVMTADRLGPDPDDLEEDLRLLTLVADVVSQAVGAQRLLHEQTAALEAENRELRALLVEEFGGERVVGGSAALVAVRKQIGLLARSNASVLITGEAGTGKQTVAKAIHFRSRRAAEPLLRIDCSGASEAVLEECLLDREEGVERVPGGTLLLDEAGRLAAATQERLARLLLERCGERGVRVIATTSQNLAQEVRSGRFSRDLYHRLNGVPLHLPPLRDRKSDIPHLVKHIAGNLARQRGSAELVWSGDCLDLFQGYPWPGNVRELEQVVAQCLMAVQAEAGAQVLPAHLPGFLRGDGAAHLTGGAGRPDGLEEALERAADRLFQEAPAAGVYRSLVERVEGVLLPRALSRAGGVRLRAARLLGINRNTLYKKLDQLEDP